MLARRPMPEMTFDEYVEWEAGQEERWELVDGRPVRKSYRQDFDPATGMARTTGTHSAIVSNLMLALGLRLRGGPCWAAASEMKVQSEIKSSRYPDITIECGPKTRDSMFAAEPRVIIEVLSRSNSFPERLLLLDDYQAISSVSQVMYVDQVSPTVLSWTRHDPFWPRDDLNRLDQLVEIESLGLEIPLSEIYDAITFDEPAE